LSRHPRGLVRLLVEGGDVAAGAVLGGPLIVDRDVGRVAAFAGRLSRLNCARAMARHNIVQTLCADIPAPPDAEAGGQVHDWEEWSGERFGRMYNIRFGFALSPKTASLTTDVTRAREARLCWLTLPRWS
jgi:hypothetical protein